MIRCCQFSGLSEDSSPLDAFKCIHVNAVRHVLSLPVIFSNISEKWRWCNLSTEISHQARSQVDVEPQALVNSEAIGIRQKHIVCLIRGITKQHQTQKYELALFSVKLGDTFFLVLLHEARRSLILYVSDTNQIFANVLAFI